MKILTGIILLVSVSIMIAGPVYVIEIDSDNNEKRAYPAAASNKTYGVCYGGHELFVTEEEYNAGYASLTTNRVNELIAEEAARIVAREEARKTPLQKTAETALITVLIREGFVAEGTTALTNGVEAAVTAELLSREIANPTNSVNAALSAKLDRLTSLIRRLGGTPDKAKVYGE